MLLPDTHKKRLVFGKRMDAVGENLFAVDKSAPAVDESFHGGGSFFHGGLFLRPAAPQKIDAT